MANAGQFTGELPWNSHIASAHSNASGVSNYQTELQSLASQGKLSGLPPQVLSYIMEAESGPSYLGGGWNGQAGGWFGLEPGDGGITQAEITSLDTFDQQAEIAANIYAKLLSGNGGNPIAAENQYQTGHPNVAANGAGIFESFGLLASAGALDLGQSAGGAVPANPFPGPVGAVAGLATGGTSVPNVGNPISDVNSFFAAVGSGFGIGWHAVLTIIGGALLILIGVLILLRHQVEQGAAAVA